uniref:F180B protein n=1 Tax=Zonotrichia albicollis TaxID=44394 RepID=A0A8D2N5P2_ZONAL
MAFVLPPAAGCSPGWPCPSRGPHGVPAEAQGALPAGSGGGPAGGQAPARAAAPGSAAGGTAGGTAGMGARAALVPLGNEVWGCSETGPGAGREGGTWSGTRPAVRERPPLGPPEVCLAALRSALLAARPGVMELCWAFRDSAAPLFQMLWGRLDIQANGTIRLRDEELASLRPARRFLQILEEEVPKTPAEIEQHLRYYSLTDTPLPPTEFDRLLFTSVYSAYQVRSVQGLDKNPWIGFFSQLVDEIFRDLCKGLCPANSTLLQASWPWKDKPSHLASLKHFYRSNLARTKRDT